jgi:NADPH-dependent 7-cyano-7-deazaguanine reductase QueF-like protein
MTIVENRIYPEYIPLIEEKSSEVYFNPLQTNLMNTLEEHNAMTRRDIVSLLKSPRTTI